MSGLLKIKEAGGEEEIWGRDQRYMYVLALIRLLVMIQAEG